MNEDCPSRLESTGELLALIRQGDGGAREYLLGRYLPVLRRWASGRLPRYSRDLADTDDLVQVTLLRTLDRLQDFELRGDGAFFAYLRQILLNAMREEIRRKGGRAGRTALDEDQPDPAPSVVEEAVGRETLEAYERGLAALTDLQREAVVLRVELGLGYAEIAQALARPSPSAARMLVNRALVQLAEQMDERGA